MSIATYEIAETDELEAFGQDDSRLDTSAGLGQDDPVETVQYGDVPMSNGKRKWCLCLVIAALTLAATAAILGIVFSVRTRGDQGSGDETPGGPGTASIPKGDGEDSSLGDNSDGLEPISPSEPKPSPVTVLQPPPPTTPPEDAKLFSIQVLGSSSHDPSAFTQGLEFDNGVFYESTGLRGQSSLRRVEVNSGKVLQKQELKDMTLFGEGITLHGSHHIFMLTWQSGRGFIFNQTTFEIIKEWRYEGEGWGLALDRENEEVYMSDGTTQLRVLDPDDLSEKRRVNVTLNGKPVTNLNELEWVCGEIWSNVWLTSRIYRIEPSTGVVKSVIDASILPLKGDNTLGADVLNGIAFDADTGRLWFTGKKWSKVYQVSVTDDSLDLKNCK